MSSAKFFKSKAIRLIMLLASAGTISIYFFWPLLTKRDLGSMAVEYRKRFLAGDLEFLYDECFEWEQKQLPLSRSQIARLRDEFLLPKIRGIQFLRSISTDVDPLTGIATERCRLRFPNGREADWTTWAVLTEQGPKFHFSDVISHGWILGRMKENALESERMAMANGWYEGSRRDAPLLESIGVPGLGGRNASTPVSPWAVIQQRSVRVLEVATSRERSSG